MQKKIQPFPIESQFLSFRTLEGIFRCQSQQERSKFFPPRHVFERHILAIIFMQVRCNSVVEKVPIFVKNKGSLVSLSNYITNSIQMFKAPKIYHFSLVCLLRLDLEQNCEQLKTAKSHWKSIWCKNFHPRCVQLKQNAKKISLDATSKVMRVIKNLLSIVSIHARVVLVTFTRLQMRMRDVTWI